MKIIVRTETTRGAHHHLHLVDPGDETFKGPGQYLLAMGEMGTRCLPPRTLITHLLCNDCAPQTQFLHTFVFSSPLHASTQLLSYLSQIALLHQPFLKNIIIRKSTPPPPIPCLLYVMKRTACQPPGSPPRLDSLAIWNKWCSLARPRSQNEQHLLKRMISM